MPYISNQRGSAVYWEEITAENESEGSCTIEKPQEASGRGMVLYNIRKNKDMKKGIMHGLKHENFNYSYE